MILHNLMFNLFGLSCHFLKRGGSYVADRAFFSTQWVATGSCLQHCRVAFHRLSVLQRCVVSGRSKKKQDYGFALPFVKI
jgi:hypothetical protein